MNKNLVYIFAIIITISCSNAQEVEGVWTFIRNPSEHLREEKEFSWGKSDTIPTAIEIDLHALPPTIKINEFGIHEIQGYEIDDNVITLSFVFRQSQETLEMKIHLYRNNTMWIEPIDGYSIFGSGEDFIYYKISGP